MNAGGGAAPRLSTPSGTPATRRGAAPERAARQEAAREGAAGPWRTVVVAPHFDDAALSLGGLLPELPGPAAVVTVHGGPAPVGREVSWWDTACGFSDPAEAHAHRLAEDAGACAVLGAEQVALPEPDGPYREPGGEPSGLAALLRGLRPEAEILVPLGTNQPDHAAVREETVRLLAALGRPLPYVYADLPYTGHLPGWADGADDAALAASTDFGPAYRRLTARYGVRPHRTLVLDDAQWARKRAAVLCHGSQLAALGVDHGHFLSRGGPLRAERVWALRPRE